MNYKKGFTLVELLTVIAMIGILASVVVVNLSGAKARGRDSRRVAELKNLELATQRYFQENFSFPVALTDLQEYFDGESYLNDPLGEQYQYYYVDSPKTYYIGGKMETSISNNVSCPQELIDFESNYCLKGP